MKKFFFSLLGALLILGGAALWGYHQLQQVLYLPISIQQNQLLTVEKGTNSKQLVTQLSAAHLLPPQEWFASALPWLIKFKSQYQQIKAGTYSLNGVKNIDDLLRLLNSGKEAQFSLRFTEGETSEKMLKSLENAPYLVQTLKGKSIQEIMQILGLPERGSLEGWIYPDTYNYAPNSTDSALLKRTTDRMQKALQQAWENRADGLPLKNAYEMLILASIVEKESGVQAERGKIASVFINRLNKGWKLETDPTVIYGMGDNYQGNIRKKDLETPTPYNTYVIGGLPPTPIAMPSESALQAVAHPEQTDFMFFVADGSGGHQFSRTLSEHNQAVQKYLRWYQEQKKGK